MSSGPDGREPFPVGGSAAIGRRERPVGGAAVGLATGGSRFAAAASPGQLTWGVHVSLAPTWFEPAEASGIITPFMVLYALHDAMVKPMPGKALAPSLAEILTASEDGRSYDFVLREGARFHNGDPVTTGRRQVFVRALSRRRARPVPGARRGGRNARRPARPLPPEGAMAGFPDLLRNGDGGGLGRAEELRREGGRGRFQEGAGRRRPLQIRLVHPRGRARARGVRPVLAQEARGPAPRLQGDPGREHAPCSPSAGRDRHRLFGARRAGRAVAHAYPA